MSDKENERCYGEYLLGELYYRNQIEYMILGTPDSQRNDYYDGYIYE